MEQLQKEFSDSTPKAGIDRSQNPAKTLISKLQLISISHISTQK